jgi:serine/threonine-protein kinase
VPRPAPAAPPPPGGPAPAPPGLLLEDVWPWLALLGILVVAGLLVWLFVFHDRGHKGTVVPAVVGLPQQQAVAKITHAGVDVKVIIGASAKPRGVVVSQSPGGGSRIGKSQSVTLHVSNGHALQTSTATTQAAATTGATTTAPPSTAAVPSVTGQDMASAAGQIEAAGFVAETDPTNASGTPGSVVSQSPSGGSAPAGSVVRLSVATGASRPPVQVPSLSGQKAAAARAALLNAKLTARTVYKKGPAKDVGVVLAESPTGSQPAYTQITLTVGS